MLITGLTGGITSGKSLVRQMLEAPGVLCFNADIVARAIHQDAQHPAVEQIESILSMQSGRVQRLRHAHDVLHNDGSVAALQAQVLALHQEYLSLWS